jgi:hypothetical protein
MWQLPDFFDGASPLTYEKFPFLPAPLLSHSVIESLPAFSAALAIPDLAALIFSAYCNGMRGDFHPPACVIAAKSMSSSARSCAAPTRVE